MGVASKFRSRYARKMVMEPPPFMRSCIRHWILLYQYYTLCHSHVHACLDSMEFIANLHTQAPCYKIHNFSISKFLCIEHNRLCHHYEFNFVHMSQEFNEGAWVNAWSNASQLDIAPRHLQRCSWPISSLGQTYTLYDQLYPCDSHRVIIST